jgi:hypothetical protein
MGLISTINGVAQPAYLGFGIALLGVALLFLLALLGGYRFAPYASSARLPPRGSESIAATPLTSR